MCARSADPPPARIAHRAPICIEDEDVFTSFVQQGFQPAYQLKLPRRQGLRTTPTSAGSNLRSLHELESIAFIAG